MLDLKRKADVVYQGDFNANIEISGKTPILLSAFIDEEIEVAQNSDYYSNYDTFHYSERAEQTSVKYPDRFN